MKAANPLAPLAFLSVSAVFIVVVLQSGFSFMLSPLDQDAVCFVPVAKNLLNEGNWVNELYHPSKVVHPSRPDFYNWHGFSSPWLWAKVAIAGSGYEAVRLGGILCSLIGVLALGCLFHRQMSKLDLVSCVVGGLILLGMAPYLFHDGRPESVFATMSVCFLLMLNWIKPAWQSIAGGAMTIALGITHPIVTVLTLPLIGIFLWREHRQPWSLIVEAGKFLFGCAITSGILLPILPYPFLEWINGMRLHASGVVFNASGFDWAYLLTSAAHPVVAVTGGILIWFITGAFFQTFKLPWERLLICVVTTFWLFLVWYFALRVSTRIYNLTALFPALSYVFFYLSVNKSAIRSSSVFFVILSISTVALPGIVTQTRYFGVCAANLISGEYYTRSAARTLVEKHVPPKENKQANLQFSSGLFELTGSFANVTITDVPTADVYFLQQANRGLTVPPNIQGYVLVENHFLGTAPHILGIRLANTPGDYHFAIYRKAAR